MESAPRSVPEVLDLANRLHNLLHSQGDVADPSHGYLCPDVDHLATSNAIGEVEVLRTKCT